MQKNEELIIFAGHYYVLQTSWYAKANFSCTSARDRMWPPVCKISKNFAKFNSNGSKLFFIILPQLLQIYEKKTKSPSVISYYSIHPMSVKCPFNARKMTVECTSSARCPSVECPSNARCPSVECPSNARCPSVKCPSNARCPSVDSWLVRPPARARPGS